MKYNAFNEPIIQPGDDVGVVFGDKFGLETDAHLTARFIEHDENFNWCCQIETDDGDEISAHDFESKEALIEFLKGANVDIEG